MNWNMYLYLQKPTYQVLLFLILTPLVILIVQPKTADKAWSIATYVFVLFMIVNATLLWFADSSWRYFFYSIGSAIGYLLIIAFVMQGMFKILKLESSEESAMAFLIIIYQPVALLLVMLIKWIVTEWF